MKGGGGGSLIMKFILSMSRIAPVQSVLGRGSIAGGSLRQMSGASQFFLLAHDLPLQQGLFMRLNSSLCSHAH